MKRLLRFARNDTFDMLLAKFRFYMTAFVACLFWVGFVPSFAGEKVRVDYSGWTIGKAFGDLARQGQLNIVGDFPPDKVSCFRLNSDTYIEEAINLLARSNNFVMRKSGEIWVAVPTSREAKFHPPVGIAKLASWRPPSTFLEALNPLFQKETGIWFPPFSGCITISGTREIIEEFKKTFETLDTPTHSIRFEFSLSRPGCLAIASGSFTTISRRPFRFALKPANEKEFGVEMHGTCGGNDDGIISLSYRSSIRFSGGRYSFAQNSFGKESEWVEQTIDLGETALKFAWRGIYFTQTGRIMPAPAPTNLSAPSTPQNENRKSVATKPEDLSKFFKTISVRGASILEKPIVLENAQVAVELEKLAEQEEISLICDDSPGGTISAYCYGERLDKGNLIKVIAQAKGLKVFSNSGGYTIANLDAIRGLDVAKQPPYTSPQLKILSAHDACNILKDGFKKGKIIGSIEAISGNRLQIQAETSGLAIAKTLCEAWSAPIPVFALGLEIVSPTETFSDRQDISSTTPFQKVWTGKFGKNQVRVAQLLGNSENGLQQVEYTLDAIDAKFGRCSFQASTRLPAKSALPFLISEGIFPIQLRWHGTFSSNYDPLTSEPPSESDSDQLFDDIFDDSF